MNTEIVVRPFRPEDARAVSSLVAHTMRVSNAQDYRRDRLEALIAYFTPEKLRVLASERHCLVATHQGNVIATAARDGSALATFFVSPDYQGRGIGSRLLAALEYNAASAGLDHLRVDASVTGPAFTSGMAIYDRARVSPERPVRESPCSSISRSRPGRLTNAEADKGYY